MADNNNGHLSNRGVHYADPKYRQLMFDVVADLWHPENNPRGYVSLGVAENTLMHDKLVPYFLKVNSLTSHALTYGDGFSGSHHLRDTLASFVNGHFNPVQPVVRRHVAITSGVGPALESVAYSICDPGDGVLLGRPYYGGFGDITPRASSVNTVQVPYFIGRQVQRKAEIVGRVKIVPVIFDDTDPFSIDAIPYYEKTLQDAKARGVAVKGLILCNPHNPLGRCYSREVLVEYFKFAERHQIHLISDEIYALSIWKNPNAPDAPTFCSVLSIDRKGLVDPSLVHVLWGMSKDFGSNGLRMGCIISQHNPVFHRSLDMNAHYICPSALSDRVTAALLSDTDFSESIIKENSERLAGRYASITRFLDANGIPYQKGSNAGFFLWVDLQSRLASSLGLQPHELGSEEERWALEARMQEMLLAHRVFVSAGAAFGSYRPGWFRVIFAHEEVYLYEGLKRILEAVEAISKEVTQDRLKGGVSKF